MPKIIACICAMVLWLSQLEGYGQCTVSLGNEVIICSGDSVALGANLTINGNTGPVDYSWSHSLGNSANPVVHPTTNTTYTLTVSGGGCPGPVTGNIVVQVKPSPIASFDYSPASPCAGIPIEFNSNVTGCTGCVYSWNFGDPSSGSANTSAQPNPSHTFNSIGGGSVNYTVTLTVTSANGCTDVYSNVINVKQSPNAVLTEDVNFTQCLGLSSFFAYVTDNSSPATITNYRIEWGDNTPPYNSSVPPTSLEHIYEGIDIWTLDYQVTGPNGCTSSSQYTVTNISNPAIGAATDGNTLQCGPVEVCFDLSNYQNNFSQIQYEINFGDGSPIATYSQSNLPDPICHEYSVSSCPGAFTFSITAVSNCPTPTVAQITPIMIFTGPTADFSAPPYACVNSAVSFTNLTIPGYNQGCNASTTYLWDFGDPASGANNTSTLANPTHTYSAPGTYTVTLTASNGGNPQLACSPTTITKTICIEGPPTPHFVLSSNEGCVPMTLDMSNTSTTTNSCNAIGNWDIGYTELPCLPNGGAYTYINGTTSTSDFAQLLLESEGTYSIMYHLQNSCGIYEYKEYVTVNTVPTVTVSTPASGICAGQSNSPTAIVNPCSLPVTYQWTFAGGTPSSSTDATAPSVSYPNAGDYNVTLAVTNACGTVSNTATIHVMDVPSINVSVMDNDLSICQGQQTTLTVSGGNTYTWSPTTYLSNIAANGSSATATPASDITYTVTGSNGACSNTASITLTVDPLPTLSADDTFTGCSGEDIQLSVTASGGSAPNTQYNWSPSDGLSQTNIPNPVFSGASSTTYLVSVTDQNGCENTLSVPVTVRPLPIVETGPDLTLCNQPVATELTGYSPTTGGTGTWSGPSVTTNGTFTPSGTGQVTLTYCFESSTTGCS
ncbi:MAG TPA: PKD domain-containing protein, partial [Flavobacteriales bacterium]